MGTRKARKGGRGRRTTRRTAGNLLTLGELARRAGVSIPTAQTYKRKYQNRLPSVGAGRKQRYKPAAIAVFQRIRAENAQRRGRRPGRPAGARVSSAGTGRVAGALSLAEIARRTKISYPTLLRYLQLHGRKIPAIGKGRTRRFPARAIQVFEQLRSQSRGGRRRVLGGGAGRVAVGTDPALSARIRRIESMQEDLTRQLSEVVRMLKQPLQLTVRPQ
jgi:DNA-binding CsgD family transcriptional regulator